MCWVDPEKPDRQMTYERLWDHLNSVAFYWFSLSLIFQFTQWSHLVQLMLGVAQWQAKGNQNQMGFRLGP